MLDHEVETFVFPVSQRQPGCTVWLAGMSATSRSALAAGSHIFWCHLLFGGGTHLLTEHGKCIKTQSFWPEVSILVGNTCSGDPCQFLSQFDFLFCPILLTPLSGLRLLIPHKYVAPSTSQNLLLGNSAFESWCQEGSENASVTSILELHYSSPCWQWGPHHKQLLEQGGGPFVETFQQCGGTCQWKVSTGES